LRCPSSHSLGIDGKELIHLRQTKSASAGSKPNPRLADRLMNRVGELNPTAWATVTNCPGLQCSLLNAYGKVAVVTGASKGIGVAIAKSLAAEGRRCIRSGELRFQQGWCKPLCRIVRPRLLQNPSLPDPPRPIPLLGRTPDLHRPTSPELVLQPDRRTSPLADR